MKKPENELPLYPPQEDDADKKRSEMPAIDINQFMAVYFGPPMPQHPVLGIDLNARPDVFLTPDRPVIIAPIQVPSDGQRYCSYCGTKVGDEQRFCHECGAPLPVVSAEEKPEKKTEGASAEEKPEEAPEKDV